MTTSSLEAITNPEELLHALKDLKNSLIGNVPRKVDVARDGYTIALLLRQISTLSSRSTSASPGPIFPRLTLTDLELCTESAVILSSLASVGDLVLGPLLSHHAPTTIMRTLSDLLPLAHSQVHRHDDSTYPSKPPLTTEQDPFLIQKTIPSLCKSLRNILHAAGKVVFGHMTGVGVEVEVVRTGWGTAAAVISGRSDGEGVEDVVMADTGTEDHEEVISPAVLRGMTSASVQWLFERRNVAILLDLITFPRTAIPLTLLPVYQLFAQLTLLPSQRSTLMSIDLSSISCSSDPTLRTSPGATRPLQTFAGVLDSPTGSTSRIPSPTSPSFPTPVIPDVRPSPLISSVVRTVLSSKINVKVKEAGLDFLSSLTREERGVALEVFGALRECTNDPQNQSIRATTLAKGYEPLQPFVDMMESRTNGLTASAIVCLTNVLKGLPTASSPAISGRFSDATSSSASISTLPVNVFPSLIYLLGQGLDERIRATFTLARLISDSPDLQTKANAEGCTKHIIEAVQIGSFADAEVNSNMDTLTRLWEGALLSLAALALRHETSRAAVVDAGILPQLKAALSNASYGLRASACQVVRAISRSSAILRTSLLDSGVSEETFKLLIDEEKLSAQRSQADSDVAATSTREDTVLVAATATICNLITEFSPVQTAMIDQGGIEVLVRLCNTTSTAVRVNALWALRNMLYKNDMKIKKRVMECLSWKGLTQLGDAPADVQEQAFAVLRNLISEATEEEIDFVWTGLGEANLFSFISYGLTLTGEPECLEQVLYILYNLALGGKMHREAVLSRPPLLSAMSRTLNNENPLVLVAALRAFSSLVESRDKHRRPRPDAVNKVRHLDIEPRLRQLTSDPVFDVRHEARYLLSHLETLGSGR